MADKKSAGGGNANPRKTGPANLQKVGKAGPGGGKPPTGDTPDPKNVKRGQKSVGAGSKMAGKRDAQVNTPTTTAKKTGTLKKK
jgi:hypothetical protein